MRSRSRSWSRLHVAEHHLTQNWGRDLLQELYAQGYTHG
jgi:hypothetical protein